jgi:hypothetical protein
MIITNDGKHDYDTDDGNQRQRLCDGDHYTATLSDYYDDSTARRQDDHHGLLDSGGII